MLKGLPGVLSQMRVLAGIDLSKDDCVRMVDQAARFTAHGNGTLDLIFAAPAHDQALQDQLGSLLEQRVSEAHRGRAICAVGTPVDVIVEYSKEYDVLVVGPRATALERLLLGTIAIRVMRRAECAVFVPRVAELPWRDTPRMLLGAQPAPCSQLAR